MSDSGSIIFLKSIDRKMDQVIKLLAMNAVRDKPEIDQIRTLKALGLTFEEIGAFLGTGADAPRKRLNKEDKSPNKGGKGGK